MSETTGHRFELSWLGWRTIDARGRRVRIARFFRGVDRDAFEEQAILRWKNSCFEDSFGYEGVERGLWMQCIYAAFALVIATPLTGYAIILAMTNIEPSFPAIALLMTVTILLTCVFVGTFKPPRRQIIAMLRDYACPVCMHNMKDAREDDDGCTACPECGAAWRMPLDAANGQRSSRGGAEVARQQSRR